MRTFLRNSSLPFFFLAAIIVFPLGNWLSEGTDWHDGSRRDVRTAIEAVLLTAIGLGGYLLHRRFLARYPTEIWFSTKAQFDAFDDAVKNTSPLRKSFGRYRIRDGAAYLRMLPGTKIPLVLVARGTLAIDSGYIRFSPLSRSDRPDRRYRNLWDGFSFDLTASQIVSVEPFERPPTTYSLPWTRVVTDGPAPLDDFLISVGGGNAYGMDGYRAKALKLRSDLQAMALPRGIEPRFQP